ncbi:MAG: hypothetical protein ABSH34_14820, partial [Verrucomicrobiota bacterium]
KLSQDKTCEPWIYLVSTWTVEPLLKERSQLMAEKKEEPKKEEPKKEETPAPAAAVPQPKPANAAKPADATAKPADAPAKPADTGSGPK